MLLAETKLVKTEDVVISDELAYLKERSMCACTDREGGAGLVYALLENQVIILRME